jgi:hypothetical protein
MKIENNIIVLLLLVVPSLAIGQTLQNDGKIIVSGGKLVITGSYLNNTLTSEIIVDGSVLLTGNWTNNSSSVGIIGSGTNGNVIFNGSTTQTIGGTAVQSNFENFTVNSGAIVEIPVGKNVTVNGATAVGGTFNIKSDVTGSASFIPVGAVSGNGSTNVERYLTGLEWHIISPPVSGGLINTFLASVPNGIATGNGGTSYGMADYNEITNLWNSYFSISSPPGGNFPSGKGYEIRKKLSGAVTFSGNLAVSPLVIPLTRAGDGWNCIGNPYPSAVRVRGVLPAGDNFLGLNYGQLEPGYEALYIFDPANPLLYRILNNSGIGGRYLSKDYIQPGQGFLVKAKTSPGSVNFTTAMKSHENITTAPFYKKSVTDTPWPSIIIKASGANTDAFTAITFNENMTKGLDVTYDAGLLGGDKNLIIYSRLVEGININIAIQCLPDNETDTMIVPIGIEMPIGGLISFSAETFSLPIGYNAILEDRKLSIFTDLATQNSNYTAIMDDGTTGSGRFFLNIVGEAKGLKSSDIQRLTMYAFGKKIYIQGTFLQDTNAGIYDLTGRLVSLHNLEKSGLNTIDASELKDGIYIIKVSGSGFLQTGKVFIN